MAHYYHTRNIRIQRTNDELDLQNKMANRVKDYDNDIIPNIIDGRTKSEKLQNKHQQDELIRKLVFNLFDNDSEYSMEYISLMEQENIDFEIFQSIYDDLEKRFKGKNIKPQNVFYTTKSLINNFINSGNTLTNNNDAVLNNLQDIMEKINNIEFKTEYERQNATDKLEAVKYLYQNIFNNDIAKMGISDLSNEEFGIIKGKIAKQVNELIKLFDEPDMDEMERSVKFFELIHNIKGTSILEAQRIIGNK
jgi:hypothetical protein